MSAESYTFVPCEKMEGTDSYALEPGQAHKLKRGVRSILVVTGKAWLTFDGEDLVADSCDEVAIPARAGSVIISAAGKERLVYEMR
jgi:hypothetical protein